MLLRWVLVFCSMSYILKSQTQACDIKFNPASTLFDLDPYFKRREPFQLLPTPYVQGRTQKAVGSQYIS